MKKKDIKIGAEYAYVVYGREDPAKPSPRANRGKVVEFIDETRWDQKVWVVQPLNVKDGSPHEREPVRLKSINIVMPWTDFVERRKVLDAEAEERAREYAADKRRRVIAGFKMTRAGVPIAQIRHGFRTDRVEVVIEYKDLEKLVASVARVTGLEPIDEAELREYERSRYY
jgi:hypothetical protein